MTVSSRRGFLAGALAAAAAPALAHAQGTASADQIQAKRVTVRRGRAIAASRDGGALAVAHDHRHTIAIVMRADDAVDGTVLLDAISATLHRYVVLSEGAAEAIALQNDVPQGLASSIFTTARCAGAWTRASSRSPSRSAPTAAVCSSAAASSTATCASSTRTA